MTDFNKVLTPGDIENNLVNVVIEIPKGSQNKIEWVKEKAIFKLDRVEPMIFAKPINYGFIPRTIDEDGDELDALVYTDEPLPTGVYLETKIIGVLRFEDDGIVDDKILVVPADNRCNGDHIKSLSDIPSQTLDQIAHHFDHYKDLKRPGSTIVKHWGDVDDAKEIILESIDRWDEI